MSTRAVVTIKDESDTFHIYTHGDGYPEYQVKRIADAVPFSWPLPRFEAMDFAAAFVRGSKEGGGNIYFTKGHEVHGDLEYRYEISAKQGDYFGKGKCNPLMISVFKVDGDNSTPIWSGDLAAMKRKYPKYLKAAA
jgi:hypothetical protein